MAIWLARKKNVFSNHGIGWQEQAGKPGLRKEGVPLALPLPINFALKIK